MNSWHKIWDNQNRVNNFLLETLIKADGFETGAGNFTLEDWKLYTKSLLDNLDISKDDSIFYICCGSGAFLFNHFINNHKVGGIDYSEALIGIAKTIFKGSDFNVYEASKLDTKNKYDYVVSHSVFQYFDNLDYSKRVLLKMLEKANKKVGIFDINDKSKEKSYHKIRMGSMTQDDYLKKYQGLDHMFYDKSWFKKIAKENDLKFKIFDQTFKKYSNSQLRFNVIFEK